MEQADGVSRDDPRAVAVGRGVHAELSHRDDLVADRQRHRICTDADGHNERPLGWEVQKPVANQVPKTPDNGRSSQTHPDGAPCLTCGYRTWRDTVRRIHAAWHTEVHRLSKPSAVWTVELIRCARGSALGLYVRESAALGRALRWA
jgi:hypothetical protein